MTANECSGPGSFWITKSFKAKLTQWITPCSCGHVYIHYVVVNHQLYIKSKARGCKHVMMQCMFTWFTRPAESGCCAAYVPATGLTLLVTVTNANALHYDSYHACTTYTNVRHCTIDLMYDTIYHRHFPCPAPYTVIVGVMHADFHHDHASAAASVNQSHTSKVDGHHLMTAAAVTRYDII